MKDNLEEIKKIPLVIDAWRLRVSKEVEKKLGKEYAKGAIENSKEIFAYGIKYYSSGKEIVGFIVEPRKGKGKFPSVIWNRGGTGDFGMVRVGHLFYDYKTIGPLAKKGYIIIGTQYPGVMGGEGIHQIGGEEDVFSVLDLYKILKSYKRANEKLVGMEGHSNGGLMTYLCLSKVKWIKAAVAVSAPSDEVNAHKFRKGWKEHQIKMYGGSLKERKKRSPILFVDKFCKKTPVLIMHGTSDWRVNSEDSIRMGQKLFENKVPFRLILFEGADHDLNEHREEYKNQVLNWFDRFLKNNEKLPNLKPHRG